MKGFQPVIVFVASPSDVARERKLLEDVLSEMNRTIAKSARLFLQTRRWDLDAYPSQGKDPQAVVNEQIAQMSECDLFVGMMWNRVGTKTPRAASGTIEEYNRAMHARRRHGKPDVWLYFREAKANLSTRVQLAQRAEVIKFRERVKKNGLPFVYKTPLEFRERFRTQIAMWVQKLGASKSEDLDSTLVSVSVNPYKLFYYRQNNKLGVTSLAKASGIKRLVLRRLERIDTKRGALDASRFAVTDQRTLDRLEDVLGCAGKLRAGQGDDFLTQYMIFYHTYKGSNPTVRQDKGGIGRNTVRFSTQAVVFDFGGTLTQSSGQYTTWEKIWRLVGYSVNDCSELHRRYQQGNISHQKWCDLTCRAFRARGLRRRQVEKIARQTKLTLGVAKTIIDLRKRGIKLYIVSGSLKIIIRQVLGDLYNEFEEVRANDMLFDKRGVASKIQSSPYDFRGKAEFLKRIINEQGLRPLDVLFVGNSCNDVFASESGVRTLCVNPRFTDPDKQEHWTYSIREMKDFSEIMQYVAL